MKTLLLLSMLLSSPGALAATAPSTQAQYAPGLGTTRNYVLNPGCDLNTSNIIQVPAGVLTRNLVSPMEPGSSAADCLFLPLAPAQAAYWQLPYTDPNLDGQRCEASFEYRGDASLYQGIMFVNGVAVTTKALVNSGSGSSKVVLPFTCDSTPGTPPLITIASTAAGPAVKVKRVYVGRETSVQNPMTGVGDMVYGGLFGTPTRLPACAPGQSLIWNGGGIPACGAISASVSALDASIVVSGGSQVGVNYDGVTLGISSAGGPWSNYLVTYYRLQLGSELADSSGFGNTAAAPIAHVADGPAGTGPNSYDARGAQLYRSYNTGANCGATSCYEFGLFEYTVQLWIKPVAGPPANYGLFGFQNFVPGADWVGSRFSFPSTLNYSETGNTNNIFASIPMNTVDGLWHHLIYTRDAVNAQNLRMYYDGNLVASTASSTNITANPIGNIYFGSDKYIVQSYQGYMTEVAVWNGRSMNSAEVAQLYNGGAGVPLLVPPPPGKLMVLPGGITPDRLSSTVAGNGLAGGGGSPLYVKPNGSSVTVGPTGVSVTNPFSPGNVTGAIGRLTVSGGTSAISGAGVSLDIDTGLLPSPLLGDVGKVLTATGAGTASWIVGSGGGSGNSRWTVHGSPGSPITVTAGGGITSAVEDRQQWIIQSAGGAVPITANPQISAGTIAGQEMLLEGTSDTNYAEFTDGTGLSLNGSWQSKANSAIVLVWNGVVWFEYSRR